MSVIVHAGGNGAIELVYKVCKTAEAEHRVNGVEFDKKGKEPHVVFPDGPIAWGLLTTIKALIRFSERGNKPESSLLGQDSLEEAQVEQWLEHWLMQISPCLNDATEAKAVLKLLNLFIVDRVYFVGQNLTVVDLVLFDALHNVYHALTFQEKERYIHVSRWFKQVQNQLPSIVGHSTEDVQFLRNLVYQ